MEMSSALVGPKVSPRYISITFASLDFKCNYICHNLSGFTVRTQIACSPELDCFTLLLARHLADVSCFIVPNKLSHNEDKSINAASKKQLQKRV